MTKCVVYDKLPFHERFAFCVLVLPKLGHGRCWRISATISSNKGKSEVPALFHEEFRHFSVFRSWGSAEGHVQKDCTCTEGLYLYHVQRFQHLELADTGSLLEYCHWINAKPMLRNILFTDEVHFTRNGVDSVRHTSQEIMMIYTEQSEVNTSKHAVWTNFWTIHVSSASDGKYFCNTKCQSSESKSLYWQCFSLNLSVATLSGSRNSFTDPHITNSQNLLCVKYLIYLCFPGPLLAIYVTWSSEVYSILLCEAV